VSTPLVVNSIPNKAARVPFNPYQHLRLLPPYQCPNQTQVRKGTSYVTHTYFLVLIRNRHTLNLSTTPSPVPSLSETSIIEGRGRGRGMDPVPTSSHAGAHTRIESEFALDNNARKGSAQHSTAQHSTAQHSTAQHSTAQHLPLTVAVNPAQPSPALSDCGLWTGLLDCLGKCLGLGSGV
jgi:hypothetical protein